MKRHYVNGKRANVFFDTLIVIVVLFIFSMVIIYGYSFLKEFNIDVQADSDVSAAMKNSLNDATTKYPLWTDSAFLTVFILLWFVVIIASFLIDSHPVFFIIAIILLFLLLFIGLVLSNTFQEITGDIELSSFSASYPYTNFIMSHFVEFIIAIGISIALVLYGKSR